MADLEREGSIFPASEFKGLSLRDLGEWPKVVASSSLFLLNDSFWQEPQLEITQRTIGLTHDQGELQSQVHAQQYRGLYEVVDEVAEIYQSRIATRLAVNPFNADFISQLKFRQVGLKAEFCYLSAWLLGYATTVSEEVDPLDFVQESIAIDAKRFTRIQELGIDRGSESARPFDFIQDAHYYAKLKEILGI